MYLISDDVFLFEDHVMLEPLTHIIVIWSNWKVDVFVLSHS